MAPKQRDKNGNNNNGFFAGFEELEDILRSLTPEDWVALPDTMMAHLETEWKKEQDQKPLPIHSKLRTALHKLPAHWITAIHQALDLPKKRRKKERITAICQSLLQEDFLRNLLHRLSPLSLALLRFLLAEGGWAPFSTLSQQDNIREEEDRWWWIEFPPTSPLGQLRLHSLVFVGTTTREGQKIKMAVIPQELRSPLEVLFTVPLKSKKNVATGGHVISLQEIQFQRLLGEVRVYYEEEIDWEPLLTHAETRNFLQHLKEKGLLLGELQRVWDDLYAFLFFLNHHPEKKGLDDFAAWEFSYFVSEFLPHHFLDLTLDFAQGEHLLRSLAQLYAYLKEQGSITTDAELQKAISKILQGGKIRKIRRPAIKGPEIILATLGLKTGHEHHFTYNDYWLLILWITEFEENWKYMLSCLQAGRTKQYYITDSTRKQARAEWLKRELEESGTQPIFFFQVLQPSEQDIEKAFDWFFNKEMVL